jgi:hypothetical protein
LVEVAGIEPAGAGDSTPANKRDTAYLREALIKILTEVSGKTCRNGSRVGEIEPLEKAGSGSSERKEITGAGTWTV